MKTVVEEVGTGEGFKQISLEDARKERADAVVGDEVEVLTRRTGGTTYLLGTDHLDRDLLSRIIHGGRRQGPAGGRLMDRHCAGGSHLLTVMSLNLFGDWLRDTLDPRLRLLE